MRNKLSIPHEVERAEMARAQHVHSERNYESLYMARFCQVAKMFDGQMSNISTLMQKRHHSYTWSQTLVNLKPFLDNKKVHATQETQRYLAAQVLRSRLWWTRAKLLTRPKLHKQMHASNKGGIKRALKCYNLLDSSPLKRKFCGLKP